MTPTKQAQIIEQACKDAGIDSHIEWHNNKKDAHTWAERISIRFKNGRQPRPVKNSYMYCDALDMCFFFGGPNCDIPHMAYAGYVTSESPDITQGKLEAAFAHANVVLQIMRREVHKQDE